MNAEEKNVAQETKLIFTTQRTFLEHWVKLVTLANKILKQSTKMQNPSLECSEDCKNVFISD